MSTNYFDIIDYLELTGLSQKQKDNLRPVLLTDLAKFILDQFVITLDDHELAQFEANSKKITDFSDVLPLIYRFDSDFENKKPKILAKYKDLFRLQKFTKQLAE